MWKSANLANNAMLELVKLGTAKLVRDEAEFERRIALEERKQAVAEQQIAEEKQERAARVKKAMEPPPTALLSFAMQESEPWAREQAVAQLYELYQTHGDWRTVERMMVNGLN